MRTRAIGKNTEKYTGVHYRGYNGKCVSFE